MFIFLWIIVTINICIVDRGGVYLSNSFFCEDIDIDENTILRSSPNLFKILLRDRTTRKNIIWATKTYELLGKEFGSKESIKITSITGEKSSLIRPRIEKFKYEQLERTKGKAEVFTPLWIVKKQNDIIDQEFSRLSVEEYVSKIWMEITCGEGPYMVSRYDSVTGEIVPIETRVGFVDRKLRRINQEVADEKKWFEYVKKAYQTSFGYEFQGDSLLIARENLLYTFIDYYLEKFDRHPDIKLQKEIAKIISYNVFQMDGLNYTIPYSGESFQLEYLEQLNLFGEEITQKTTKLEKENSGVYVKIRNWKNQQMNEFKSFVNKEESRMKFDVVVGNPPYQEEIEGNNRQSRPIYNLFMDEVQNISERSILITPARFLANTGATPKKWNNKMLSSTNLKIEFFEQKSSKVFPNTDIKGGVVVTYYDRSKYFESIDTFIPLKELNSIFHKVKNENKDNLGSIVYSPDSYRFTDSMFNDYPEFKNRTDTSHLKAVSSNVFERYPEVFLSDEEFAGDTVKIYGRKDGRRVFKKINKAYLIKHPNIDKWKVFIPGANGSGTYGEALSTPILGEPFMAHNQTFISIGAFDTKFEAESLLKYVKGKFSRAMLGIMKTTQNNQSKVTWSKVPMQDFTSNSDIDWSKTIPEIDQQLYKKYNLNEEEINFIETKVKEME